VPKKSDPPPKTNAASKVLTGLSNLMSSKKKDDSASTSLQGSFSGQGQVLGHHEAPAAQSSKPERMVQVERIAPVEEAIDDDTDMELNWLGERDALLFRQSDIPRMRSSAETEDFFTVTKDDVMYMLDDLKRQMTADAPLETKSMREARERAQAAKYKKAVLRITFPSDGFVLQATFEPNETVQTVIEFLRQFLTDHDLGFYVYTTPPRAVLKPADTLIHAKLVPAAMVHVGQAVPGPVLREDVKAKVTTFAAIAFATRKLREQLHGIKSNSGPKLSGAQETGATGGATAAGGSGEDENVVSPSTQRPNAGEFRTSQAVAEPQGKVPKWFKFGK